MLACALVLSCVAGVATAAGTNFPPETQINGKMLRLNGSGTRYKAVFKVYDMAMYTERAVGSAPEAIAEQGPRRLSFVAMRELESTDIGLSFVEAIQANATPEQSRRHLPDTARLIEIFSSRAKIMSDESFSLDFVPGKGTQFLIQGKPQGPLVGDAEFFSMVLNIWLGHSPVDRQLKGLLLGR